MGDLHVWHCRTSAPVRRLKILVEQIATLQHQRLETGVAKMKVRDTIIMEGKRMA